MSRIGLLIILVVFGVLLDHWKDRPSYPDFKHAYNINRTALTHKEIGTPAITASEKSLYRVRQVSDSATKEVHSASVVESQEGVLNAFWYGGTREGSKDTAIYNARLSLNPPESTQVVSWQPSEIIVTQSQAQKQLHRYIKKLGNPVVSKAPSGRLWLFYVSVSLGGWAGSAINAMHSDDQGKTWSAATRLISSPFINISTLVKSNPIYYQDGSIGLPVYHEFVGKFPELLHLDKDGRVLQKKRMASGRVALQPVIMPIGEKNAVAFLRSANDEVNRVLFTDTQNGGKHWSELRALSLLNPNSAVAGWRRPNGDLMLVFNNSPMQRDVLSLAVSKDDGRSWTVVHDFENESNPPYNRFSYPTMIQSRDGHYHMLYTWNRTHIKHVEFNEAWLEKVM